MMLFRFEHHSRLDSLSRRLHWEARVIARRVVGKVACNCCRNVEQGCKLVRRQSERDILLRPGGGGVDETVPPTCAALMVVAPDTCAALMVCAASVFWPLMMVAALACAALMATAALACNAGLRGIGGGLVTVVCCICPATTACCASAA